MVRENERNMTKKQRQRVVCASVYAWDSRLGALSFQHRLHRQVTSLRVFGEVLL